MWLVSAQVLFSDACWICSLRSFNHLNGVVWLGLDQFNKLSSESGSVMLEGFGEQCIRLMRILEPIPLSP